MVQNFKSAINEILLLKNIKLFPGHLFMFYILCWLEKVKVLLGRRKMFVLSVLKWVGRWEIIIGAWGDAKYVENSVWERGL